MCIVQSTQKQLHQSYNFIDTKNNNQINKWMNDKYNYLIGFSKRRNPHELLTKYSFLRLITTFRNNN